MEWHMQSPDGSVSVAPRRPALISNQGMLLLEAALAGEGLALLPNWSVRSFIEEGALEEITFQDAKNGPLCRTRNESLSALSAGKGATW